MSVNIRDYVSDNHIESIGEIAKSQSAIIQALSLDNSKLEREIERFNKIRQQVIDELFDLKNMIYKPETREINFDVQNKISSIIKILGSDK